jgi:hypothetical protein
MKKPEKFGLSLWRHMDSNQGPSACKADALNQLSYASFSYSRKGSAKIGLATINANGNE